MLCHQAEQRMQEHLDQILLEKERVLLATHLLDCPSCRRRLSQFERLHTLSNQLPMLEPDSIFVQRIMQQVHRKPVLPRKRRRASIAALVPIVLGLAYLGLLGWGRFVSPYVITWRIEDATERFASSMTGWLRQITPVQNPWFWLVLLSLVVATLFWNHRMLTRKSEKLHD